MTHVTIVIISKDERSLGATLDHLRDHESRVGHDVVVVDASRGRLDDVMASHPDVHWVSYAPKAQRPKSVTIPEQRNLGVCSATGALIVFVDAGCRPLPGWLDALVDPLIRGSESVTAGSFRSITPSPYDARTFTEGYVEEAPTLNMALTRTAFDRVGGFDETFSYCSDTDFCWRVADAGLRIKLLPAAQVMVDWGGARRQHRRAWHYGAGRARLYRKHRGRLRTIVRRDPIIVVYPVFLLGLPLTLLTPAYPLLLLVPLWRARHAHPWRTLADHLCYGAGALGHLVRVAT